MPENPVMCPVCGWTGTHDDLDTAGVTECPVCDETIEAVA